MWRATYLAAALWTAKSLSSVKLVEKTRAGDLNARSERKEPQPLLILRLAYSGSSWFTQMISEQNDTYITREANWLMGGENRERVANMSADELSLYVLKALVVPSGDLLHQDMPQIYDYSRLDQPKQSPMPALSVNFLQQKHFQGNPHVLECLKQFGQGCALKHIGVTMDPVGTGLDVNGEAVFSKVSKSYPDLPVLIYRRSNIVKHAIASGGIFPDAMPKLGIQMAPDEFLDKVRQSQASDKKLVESAKYFNHYKLVTYEELLINPTEVMKDVLEFLGMPFDEQYIRMLANRGSKKTPEDMRQLFSNFDELYWTLYEKSPCLAAQMRSTQCEVFAAACPDM